MSSGNKSGVIDTLSGERARLNAARWVLWGNVVFATVGVTLHTFFRLFVDHGSINWSYQIPTLGIGAAAILALRWLRQSLSRAMLSFTLLGIVCVSGLLIHELETNLSSRDYMFIIPMFHVGIFALGLILGFKAAVRYATVVALILLLGGVVYGKIDETVLAAALAYAVALPAKVVEQLVGESTAEISEINKKLRKEIAEREQAEEALRQHREHLEELVRERTVELEERNAELDAFAHTVAHDLKNPLAVVTGFAEALRECHHTLPVEDLQRYLYTLERNGRKMKNIVDELLLLAGVREMDVGTEPLDMANIVAEAQKRLVHLIEERQAEIMAPPEESWPAALGYGPWVEEVWVNYLSNAIEHGGRPPRVELGFDLSGAAREYGTVRFWVRDNGPGLTSEEQARLFTPFTQLNQVSAKGHGLGLSIVRRIVEKLGGQVGVESKVGRGSVFYFDLLDVSADLSQPDVGPESRERVFAL
jgi:signal transduction histidine kinase